MMGELLIKLCGEYCCHHAEFPQSVNKANCGAVVAQVKKCFNWSAGCARSWFTSTATNEENAHWAASCRPQESQSQCPGQRIDDNAKFFAATVAKKAAIKSSVRLLRSFPFIIII
ncbi:hypothetical protein Ddc_06730 [Ditylenchus destructor]|nr:hypothetical protein Ddc_06730 [Ditylenchus destructor]